MSLVFLAAQRHQSSFTTLLMSHNFNQHESASSCVSEGEAPWAGEETNSVFG